MNIFGYEIKRKEKEEIEVIKRLLRREKRPQPRIGLGRVAIILVVSLIVAVVVGIFSYDQFLHIEQPYTNDAEQRVELLDHRLADAEKWLRIVSSLLSSASLTLTGVSVLIALFLVFGYNLMKHDLERKVAEEVTRATKQLTGRLLGVQGLTFGLAARDPETDKVHSESHLHLAIEYTERALSAIESSSDHDDEHLWKARNNLAFYYALRAEANPGCDQKFGPAAVALVESLLEDFDRVRQPMVIDTYARVAAAFHQCVPNGKELLQRAEKLMHGLVSDPTMASKLSQLEISKSKITLYKVREATKTTENRGTTNHP